MMGIFEAEFVATYSVAMAVMMLLGLILGLAIDRAAVKVAGMKGMVQVLWDERKLDRQIHTSEDGPESGKLME